MTVIPIEFATPEYDQTVHLRNKILRIPLGLEFTPQDLTNEYQDIHLACYDKELRLQACMVFTVLNEQTIKMRQVAVEEHLQGQGIGSYLVKASEVFAARKGFKEIVLNARDVAVPFYLRLDYEKVGEPFTEVSIKHYKMRKKL